jgi:hypothetical protein
MARNAGFSKDNHCILRDAATIIKVHTISNITILNDNHIKPGITDGYYNNITKYFKFTWVILLFSSHKSDPSYKIHHYSWFIHGVFTSLVLKLTFVTGV